VSDRALNFVPSDLSHRDALGVSRPIGLCTRLFSFSHHSCNLLSVPLSPPPPPPRCRHRQLLFGRCRQLLGPMTPRAYLLHRIPISATPLCHQARCRRCRQLLLWQPPPAPGADLRQFTPVMHLDRLLHRIPTRATPRCPQCRSRG
jgi:hypothetical protein